MKVNRTMFDFGCRLALLATNIDDNKQHLSPELHTQALECVETMHALAKALLGDLAGEFYDNTEDAPCTDAAALAA